jgi:hypothetical protein
VILYTIFYVEEEANMEQKSKGLAIVTLIISIISILLSCCGGGVLGIVSIILGIVVLTKEETGKNMAIAGIVISSIALLISIVAFALGFISGFTGDKTTTETTTEVTTEATTTEATTETTEETTEVDVDELKANAEEVTYEDIYRSPETWKEKEIKMTVHINKYESKFFGTVGTYYCDVNGEQLLLIDVRKVEEPTIASGDNVTVYGLGGGLATLTESEKNVLGITTDKEESKIPQINMYAVELQ